MANKGQGLPLNLIVLAVIAALVLVLIIAFTVGGSGNTFTKISRAGTTVIGQDKDSARVSCQNACTKAEISLDAITQWPDTDYCSIVFSIDANGNGALDTGETNLKCWNVPISAGCTFALKGTGQALSRPAGSTTTSCTGGQVVVTLPDGTTSTISALTAFTGTITNWRDIRYI